MKTLLLLFAAAGLTVSSTAVAQYGQPQQYELVVPQEFQQDPNMVPQEAVPTQPSGGVVILNSQTASGTSSAEAKTASVLKNQPTTYVEASPLVESRAEQMRKQRQQAELNTEQRIVEKLEQSRLEDEKERASRLFGGKFTRPVEQQPAQQPQVYGQYGQQPQQPSVVVVPSPQHHKPDEDRAISVKIVEDERDDSRRHDDDDDDGDSRDEARDEIRKSIVKAHVAKNLIDEFANRSYVGALLGAADYQASNVDSNGAFGFSLGMYLDSRFAIEGSFIYSNFNLDEYWKRDDYFKEIDQYDFSFNTKYSLLTGRVKPYVSGGMSYIYRNYTNRSSYRDDHDRGSYSENVASDSVNANFGLGMDFFINRQFSIGFDYRYSLNVYNNSNANFPDRYDNDREPSNTEPLEEIGYSTFGFTSRILF